MKRRAGRSTCGLWLLGALVVWLSALVGGRADARVAKAPLTNQRATQAARVAAPPANQGPTYVGDEKCVVCHAAQAEKYHDSPHGRAMDARTPAAAKGCETCHGPGSLHADNPAASKVTDFTTAKASVVNAECTTCHNRGEHALWDGSKHESRGLACTTCHSMHSYMPMTIQAKIRQAKTRQTTAPGPQDLHRTDTLRQGLLERRRELQNELYNRVRDGRARRTQEGTDDLEHSEANIQNDLALAQLQMRSEALGQITAALARLDTGGYGLCTECEREIATRRLRALPFAVRCQPCEETREQAHRDARRLAPGRESLGRFSEMARA